MPGGHSAAARGQRLPAAAPPKPAAIGPRAQLCQPRGGVSAAPLSSAHARSGSAEAASAAAAAASGAGTDGVRVRISLCQLALHQLGSKSPGPGCSCPGLRARGRLGRRRSRSEARYDLAISGHVSQAAQCSVPRPGTASCAFVHFQKVVFELILNLFKQRPHRENGGPFCRLGARSSCRTQMQRSCSTSAKDAILKKRRL